MIKTAAADPRLMQHTGPAVVFNDYDDMEARMNRDDLDVDEDSVLVLQNAGPLGGPGMPEWGMLPIPKKLLQQGRARHGADLRCAHERHGLWNVRAACFAGELCRRAAGAGEGWRPDFASMPKFAGWICWSRAKNLRGAARDGPSPPEVRARLRRALSRARHAGAPGLRFRLSESSGRHA